MADSVLPESYHAYLEGVMNLDGAMEVDFL